MITCSQDDVDKCLALVKEGERLAQSFIDQLKPSYRCCGGIARQTLKNWQDLGKQISADMNYDACNECDDIICAIYVAIAYCDDEDCHVGAEKCRLFVNKRARKNRRFILSRMRFALEELCLTIETNNWFASEPSPFDESESESCQK